MIDASTSDVFLHRLTKHAPGALSSYLLCINYTDFDGQAFFKRSLIADELFESWPKFMYDLKCLQKLGFLDFSYEDEGIHVTMVQDE